MSEATSIKTASAQLVDVVHRQSDRLHDASALLNAIRASADALPSEPTQLEMSAWRDRIERLARVADEVIEEV